VTRPALRGAIAEALYPTSAHDLAAECDALGVPRVGDLPEPMASKRGYVQARIRHLGLPELLDLAGKVNGDHPESTLTHLLALAGAGGVDGQVRNIIFAAEGPKPNIVISDAISNTLKITEGAERVLVYDDPIGPEGLTWSDLTTWWAGRDGGAASPAESARQLYRRLSASLANDPERLMFRTYCMLYRTEGDQVPALLPQVYLHYDPHGRGGRATLVRQRMDFLLLLPGGRRVVLELDGAQHYADLEASACGHRVARPTKYAEMVAEDRKLRLRGYEVYRFGGAEFTGPNAGQMLTSFYRDLLGLT
jgi:hypothetical protein